MAGARYFTSGFSSSGLGVLVYEEVSTVGGLSTSILRLWGFPFLMPEVGRKIRPVLWLGLG